jgi:RNA polymerase sigma-70 factor (ECF subfamily)
VNDQRLFAVPLAAVAREAEGPEAFRAELGRHVGSAYRLASVILGSSHEAEDATQDALERAWRSRSSLRDPDRFEAWFQRIVVNCCRDRLRRRPTAIFVAVADSAGVHGPASPDPYVATAARDAVSRALERLNADQRIVVAMRFYLDLEVDEIARRLGTRPGTVKSRLHRALKVLKLSWEAEA